MWEYTRLSSMYSAFVYLFFFNDTATTEIYTLSLHDALPICECIRAIHSRVGLQYLSHRCHDRTGVSQRSEEHTSELQSPCNLVCRLLLEKKKPEWHHLIKAAQHRLPVISPSSNNRSDEHTSA